MKKKILLPAAIVILAMEYVVCRFLLFDLHKTKELPFVLLVFCVVCAAAGLKWNKLMACAVVGYIVSFLLGVTFQTEWIDPHGTACSSFGIWFACGVIFFAIAGVFWEVFHQWKIKKDNR